MKQEPSAGELKDLGNKFFAGRKYEDAISCYSRAIVSSWFSLVKTFSHWAQTSNVSPTSFRLKIPRCQHF